MTVRQVWSLDDANGEDTNGKNTNPGCYACYQGGAFRLPKTGNTLMTYGGIVTVDGELAVHGYNSAIGHQRVTGLRQPEGTTLVTGIASGIGVFPVGVFPVGVIQRPDLPDGHCVFVDREFDETAVSSNSRSTKTQ